MLIFYTFLLFAGLDCFPFLLPLVLRLRGLDSSVSDELEDSVDLLLSLQT